MLTRILYTGPALAGVTTSVRALAEKLGAATQGRYRVGFVRDSVEIWTDVRTSYYFTSTAAAIASCGESADAHMKLIKPMFEAHREYLRLIDGVVFVADSQRERREANVERLEFLVRELESLRGGSNVPIVFECNKQDIAGAESTVEMATSLVASRCRYVATCARRGEGILESFDALLALIAAR
jgi:signal recognition particle receptor subunit beta